MAFLASIAYGFATGLVFVFGLSYLQKRRSLWLMRRAAAVAALNIVDINDLKKLLQGDLLPQWVEFREMEKVDWLNKELKEIWPYVNKAASTEIQKAVEPILKQYQPPVFLSMKFRKLTLGTQAPQIAGVRVVDTQEEEVVLDVDLKWNGNQSIILGLVTLVGVPLQAQVKTVEFACRCRLIFRPLINEFPCFGALTVALLGKPELKFTLKIIGEQFGGLYGIVSDTLRNLIYDQLVWPCRIVVPIRPDPTGKNYSDLQLRKVGVLEVHLVKAINLPNTDRLGKSDPFCHLYLRTQREMIRRSRVINNDLNPVWNETFHFDVEDPKMQRLHIKVFDKETVQAAEFMGEVAAPLTDMEPGAIVQWKLKLVEDMDNPRAGNQNLGEVIVEAIYKPLGADGLPADGLPSLVGGRRSSDGLGFLSSTFSSSRALKATRGVLLVTVERGEDMVAKDLGGTSDPYVVVSLKSDGTRRKTKIIPKTLNPVWNETFEFVTDAAEQEMVMFECYDHDIFGKDNMGQTSFTLFRVMKEGEVSDVFPLEGVPKGKLYLTIKFKRLPDIAR